jgi:HTH-type transcriptional regulator/antitoxin HigA
LRKFAGEDMSTRIIKSEGEYKAALNEAERLVARDPEPDTPDADRLDLITLLIEDFEKRTFSQPDIDPIDAIEFRMAMQGLRQKDLVPILGSRSRVSEVLGRKRSLTLQMIRSLSTGLGISAEVLIAETANAHTNGDDRDAAPQEGLDWNKFPVKEMEKRGWFNFPKEDALTLEEKVREFFALISNNNRLSALYRRSFRGEQSDERTYYSTLAWSARVLMKAKAIEEPLPKFDPSRITSEILRDLARLSWFENGPKLALEFLSKYGIATVIEPRLPNALIDGAAMLTEQGHPVIGLTLRIDRVDYFWFTLLHEVAHVWKHLNTPDEAFIDRIDKVGFEQTQAKEKEANRIARDAFIRRAIWERSPAHLSPDRQNIQELADQLHIHPAIVVGRIQFESGRYESFREFLGEGSIRRCFPEVIFP